MGDILDEYANFVMNIDPSRSLAAILTKDKATIVLTMEDPAAVTVVELTKGEAREFVVKLSELIEGVERGAEKK